MTTLNIRGAVLAIVGAAVVGGSLGAASTLGRDDLPTIASGLDGAAALARPEDDVGAVASDGARSGSARTRTPRVGDRWPGCHAVRAAGAAPLFRGEPGYREDMDGDGDGIACEPYHG